MKKYLFVGEKRSTKAISMNVTWKDGKLAAKQLFDALKHCDINPEEQEFCNYFEKGGKKKVKESNALIIGMGIKVQNALKKDGFKYISIIHPAARGKIRKKENYYNHIKQKLL